MTLIQGAGVDWPGPSIVTYSLPPAANPPSPLKNSSSGVRSAAGRSWASHGAFLERTYRLDRVGDAIELIGKTSMLRDKHDAGGRDQQRPRLGGDQVRPKHENPAQPGIDPGSGPRLACAHQRLDRHLKVLHV